MSTEQDPGQDSGQDLNPSPVDVWRQAGLPPEAYGVLDKIASGEARGYNIRYGGSTFNSYSDHPRVLQRIPNTDKFSSAAGRYQFLSGTWDRLSRELGLSDFSPVNQDKAAWHLAKTTYASQTGGRDLAADYSAGKVDWSSLAGQWTSLAKVGAGKSSSPDWAIRGKSQMAGASAGPASSIGMGQLPQLPQLPGLAGLQSSPFLALASLQALLPNHNLIQVDYDPWRLVPKATES